MAADALILEIEVDTKTGEARLKQFDKTVDKTAKKSTDAASKMRSGYKQLAGVLATLGVAATAAAAIRTLTSSILEATKASGQFEANVVRLKNSLVNAGKYTPEAQSQMLAFAASLEKASNATQTQILDAMNLAVAMGADVPLAMLLAEAATNRAAVTGKELEESVRQLAKTLGGTSGELGETETEVTKLTRAQREAGDAIRLVAEKYEGAGERIAETFTGGILNTTSALDNLRRAFGEPMREVAKSFMNESIIPMVNGMADGVKEADSFKVAVYELGIAAGQVGNILWALSLQIKAIPKGLSLAGSAVPGLTMALERDLQILRALGGVAGEGEKSPFTAAIDDMRAKLEALHDPFDQLVDDWEDQYQSGVNAFAAISKEILKSEQRIDSLRQKIAELNKKMKPDTGLPINMTRDMYNPQPTGEEGDGDSVESFLAYIGGGLTEDMGGVTAAVEMGAEAWATYRDELIAATADFYEVDQAAQMVASAFAQMAGAQLWAALTGRKASAEALKAAVDAIGKEATIRALFEAAMGLASLAIRDTEAASKHFASAKTFGIVAAGAAAVSFATGGPPSQDFEGFGGGGISGSVGQQLTGPQRQPAVTIFIEGHVLGKSGQEVVEEITNEMQRAARRTG